MLDSLHLIFQGVHHDQNDNDDYGGGETTNHPLVGNHVCDVGNNIMTMVMTMVREIETDHPLVGNHVCNVGNDVVASAAAAVVSGGGGEEEPG